MFDIINKLISTNYIMYADWYTYTTQKRKTMIKKSIEKRIATIAVTAVALTSLFTAAAPLPRTLSIEFADIKGLVDPRYSVTEQLNRNIDYRPYKLTFHIWRDPFSAEYARYIAEYLCEIYTADKNAWLFHRFKTV